MGHGEGLEALTTLLQPHTIRLVTPGTAWAGHDDRLTSSSSYGESARADRPTRWRDLPTNDLVSTLMTHVREYSSGESCHAYHVSVRTPRAVKRWRGGCCER